MLSNILHIAGTFLIGLTALRVHHRVLNQHKIDKVVFRTMRTEQFFGFLGLAMVFASLLIEVF